MPENPQTIDLADDLLKGADEIAAFIRETPRRTYYLADKGLIPVFRVGRAEGGKVLRLSAHARWRCGNTFRRGLLERTERLNMADSSQTDNKPKTFGDILGETVVRDLVEIAVKEVKEEFDAARSRVKGGDAAVTYTRAQHRAIAAMFQQSRVDLLARYAARWKRIAALEARPELKHAGVWKEDAQYKENSLCTHKGGLWLAVIDSKAVRPGDAPAIWRLIVKSGSAQ